MYMRAQLGPRAPGCICLAHVEWIGAGCLPPVCIGSIRWKHENENVALNQGSTVLCLLLLLLDEPCWPAIANAMAAAPSAFHLPEGTCYPNSYGEWIHSLLSREDDTWFFKKATMEIPNLPACYRPCNEPVNNNQVPIYAIHGTVTIDCTIVVDDWFWRTTATSSCGFYDMKDGKVYSPLPTTVSWKSRRVPATNLAPLSAYWMLIRFGDRQKRIT
jgi:hypothetical protein